MVAHSHTAAAVPAVPGLDPGMIRGSIIKEKFFIYSVGKPWAGWRTACGPVAEPAGACLGQRAIFGLQKLSPCAPRPAAPNAVAVGLVHCAPVVPSTPPHTRRRPTRSRLCRRSSWLCRSQPRCVGDNPPLPDQRAPFDQLTRGGFRREVQPRRQHWFLNEKSGSPLRTPAFCSVSKGTKTARRRRKYRAPSVTPGVALRPRTQAVLLAVPTSPP